MTQASILRERRFIVTHDCAIFSFETVGTQAIPTSFGFFFIPTIDQKIYTAYNKAGDYMAIKSDITALYDEKGLVKKSFTKDDIKVEVDFEKYFKSFTEVTKFKRNPHKRTTCSRKKIEQVDIFLGNEDSGLEYSYFQRKAFENATLEYALTKESFLELCGKYNFSMFGDINLTRVTILDTQPLLHVNDTTISYGKYDEIDCVVKRCKVKNVGAYLNSFHIHRKVQQENMLRIYDSISDGVEYQTIMERYSGNLYEFINDIRKNCGRLNRFSRDIIKAMINLHDHRIVHGRIRPEHILVKKYISLPEVAKLGGLSRYRKLQPYWMPAY
ncbi:serine/threonine-protein kinase TIO-like protein isoform X2 [Tanacetum coccineum]